jgi:hypothetical protein
MRVVNDTFKGIYDGLIEEELFPLFDHFYVWIVGEPIHLKFNIISFSD